MRRSPSRSSLKFLRDVEFLRRPDLRGGASDDWDELVADLQYRDDGEYSVGHNVATEAIREDGVCCKVVRTCWIPEAEVEKVEPAVIPGVELSMDGLADLKDGADAKAKLGPLVDQYREWIKAEANKVPKTPAKRKETGDELVVRATVAANRIESGIKLLATPDCLEAFRIANKCMAEAARRRFGVMQGKPYGDVKPAWRPFQLAFLLMNLKAIAEPGCDDRDVVDLLFFPTGGGKTEAYLGLAAFTLGASEAAESWDHLSGVERVDAVHSAAADVRTTQPRRDADLRSRTGTPERCGEIGRLAL